MRQIVHPGIPSAHRIVVVEGSAVAVDFLLQPGLDVNTAVRRGFAEAGCEGGFARISGGGFRPFNYVIPAGSPDAEHVAWFSETLTLAGPVAIEDAGISVGWRDGQPFLHCHGLWSAADGARHMGHLLPLETSVGGPARAVGIGFPDAAFDAVADAETNFKLFEPAKRPRQPKGAARRALLARVRPNEEICLAIEALCASRGIRSAKVHGIGSLIGVALDDGRTVASHATEVLITRGSVRPGSAGPLASLDIAVVDMDGAVFEGRLRRGDNAVCVTFELVVEPLD